MRTSPFVLALIAAAPLAAQPAESPAAPAEGAVAAQPAVSPEVAPTAVEAPVEAPAKPKDTLSVDFPDKDISYILSNVADLLELNLVVPDTLQGKTTIKLRDVTWKQIFETVLTPVGYTFIEDGNIVKVVNLQSLAVEPVGTEVFILNYAKASDILPTVSSLVDTSPTVGGKIVVDSRSNALVISERPSRMKRIRPIIERLDTATEQVMIESKFVEVTNRDVKNIGVNWSSLSGYKVGAGDLTSDFTRSRTQDSSGGTTGSTNSNGANTTSGASTTTSTFTNGTTSSSSITANNTSTSSNNNGVTNAASQLASLTNGGATSRIASAVFTADDFSLVLSALQTQNNTKLVSNPTVVTLNNVEATINIGEEFPIPKYTYNAERGSYEVSNFDYRNIGINLKVTPQVNAQKFIKLTIEPEVSSRVGTTTFGGAGGAEIPIISTRKSKTQVSLRDGYTMGIGGLIENTTTKAESRVPGLGSVPGIGRLFRSNNANADARNLLIFITAKTVNAEGAPIEEVFDPRSVREMGLRRDELPGFRDGSNPFVTPPAPAPAKKPFFRLTTGAKSEGSK